MNVVTRGIRNAFRNGIRTFSIIITLSLSIALALAMVLARGAVQSKIDSVKGSIGTSITVSPAGVQGFEGGGEPLKSDSISQLTSINHVSSIAETVQDRLTTDNTSLQSAINAGSLGRRFQRNSSASGDTTLPTLPGGTGTTGTQRSFTPPITVSATDDLSSSQAAVNGQIKLTSGALFDAKSTDNVALVGKALATKNGLGIGSTFTAYGTTIKVVGIYDTGTEFTNATVVMPLATLQTLSSQVGQISSATVKVDSITNVDSTVSAIKTKLGSAADVTSQESEAQAALAPLENIKTISLFSLIGAIIAGAVIILLTMVMIVRERRREIGVLKAIGASNVKVVVQFMSEAVTFTLIAAVVGIMLGIVGGNPITKVLVNNNTSTTTSATAGQAGGGGQRQAGFGGGARNLANNLGVSGKNLKDVKAVVGWNILLYGLGSALVIALAGSATAALLIAKIRPAEVMRVE